MSDALPKTIPDLLRRHATQSPEADAFLDPVGTSLSYAALEARARGLAAAIRNAVPTKRGRPRIGIVLPNGVEIAVVLLGAAIAGEATPFNPDLTTVEFERYFKATGIDALILGAGDNGPASAVASVMGLPVLRLGEGLAFIGLSHEGEEPEPAVDDIAMVLMTSGSTGVPKIVPLSHANVCRSAHDVAASVRLTHEDRCLVMWQQFHIGGLVDLLLAPLSAGGQLILTRGFDAAAFFEISARLAPTWFQGVPTTLGELVQHAERTGIPPGQGSLRLVRSVAAALTPALQERIAVQFGVPVIRTLGMTEASPLITSTALPPAVDKPGSVGRPSGPEVRVFGADMGVRETGEEGEIAIRGENVFAGYEDNPDANASAFRDGWFFTGDLGYLDAEGDLFLTGRMKEQVNRGGYKIMPSEVEEALSRHSAVREAAVFGLKHPTLGEDIAAAVSLRPGETADAETLRGHLAGLLAANKVPNRITILPDLPRNPVGKLDRLALAQMAAAEADSAALLLAPRTVMEERVADLWKQELDIPAVGVEQDFMMVGGDSLSALRIVVAMEEMFGQPVPDAVMANFTTVAEIAAGLEAAGIALDEGAKSAEAALSNVSVGLQDFDGEGNEFEEALARAATRNDQEAALAGLVAYQTPAVISRGLSSLNARRVAARAPGYLNRFLLRRRFGRKARTMAAELSEGGALAERWARTDIASGALLYHDPDVPAWEKTLIVGFAGNMLRMQLEAFRVLLSLDPGRADFLMLLDPSRKLFLNGVPELGEDISRLGAWLDGYSEEEGYERRVTLGASGGCLAAIHVGLSSGWNASVAASPPALAKHTEWAEVLRALAATEPSGEPDLTISHGKTARDSDAARQVAGLFPAARHEVLEAYTTHNILNAARKEGKLGAQFDRWFGAPVSPSKTG